MSWLVAMAAATLSDGSVKAHALRRGLTLPQLEVSSENGHYSAWMASYGQPRDLMRGDVEWTARS